MPNYNHTREDGPFNPCDECLLQMNKKDLIALVKDLQEQLKECASNPLPGDPRTFQVRTPEEQLDDVQAGRLGMCASCAEVLQLISGR